MNSANPVVTQAISAATIIALIKAIVVVLKAFDVFNFDEDQDSAVNLLIDTGIPIVAVLGGAWWASRKVTSLAAPRDVDGATLSRPDNAPAIGEMESIHQEALKVNQSVDKATDDRRIKR